MVALLLVLVTLTAAPGWPQTADLLRRRGLLGLRRAALLAPLGLLAVAAVLAAAVGTPAGGPLGPHGLGAAAVVVPAAVAAAVVAGGPWTTAVLEAVRRGQRADATISAVVLRGGAAIGALERAAVAATLLAGWPEGLAVVLAVKGLGRYDELRASTDAAERFIVGTFASGLWAAACTGVAVLATR